MKKNIQKIYPLTPMQEGMLFHSLNDDNNSYFTQFLFTNEGVIEVDQLKKCVEILSQRHDIFRTAIVHNRTEKPIQVVLKNRQIELNVEDVAHLEEKEQQEYFERYIEKDRQRGFDLTKDPLLRISVLKVAEEKYEFIWSNHHIVLDGWCFGILLRELDLIYNALVKDEPIDLPPAIPFGNYVKWLENQDTATAAEFWKNYLEGYEEQAIFPADLPQTKETDQEEEVENLVEILTLSKEKADALKEIARKEKVTPSIIIQAVWGILLARYTYRKDVVYGNVVSGRPSELEGADEILGMFINTLPLRIRFDEETTFTELIKNAHQEFISGIPYHYLSLAEVQTGSSISGELFHHFLAFQDFLGGEDGEETDSVLNVTNVRNYDPVNYKFFLNSEIEEEIKFYIYYNPTTYSEQYIQDTLKNIAHIVDQILAQPEHQVSALELVGEEEWSQKAEAQEQIDTQKAYWSDQLEGLGLQEFPRDFHPEEGGTSALGSASIAMAKEDIAQLESFAKAQGTDRNTCLFAAYAALLNRYNRQSDLCILTERFPLRMQVNPAVSFENWSCEVQKLNQAATENSLLSLDEILASKSAESLGRLFPFQFLTYDSDQAQADDFTNRSSASENKVAPILTLSILDNDQEITCSLVYDQTLFKAETIDRLLQHYIQFLRSALSAADKSMCKLPILNQAEEQQILVDFNDTQFEYPSDQTIVQLFEKQVRKTPDAAALVYEGQTTTYQELNEQASKLAYFLQSNYTIEADDKIGVMMERSTWSIISIFGILKAGAAYVPIELKYPLERKKFMIEDTQLKLLIIQSENLFDVLDLGVEAFSIDIELSEIEEPTEGAFSNTTSKPTDLAYIMYTSGSTGKPKGVLIEQRSILRLVYNQRFTFLNEASTLYHFAPMAFDASTFEIWGALLKGGKLVIAKPGQRTLEEITEEMNATQVDTLWLTAGLFHQAVEDYPNLFANLKYILAGGDSIRPTSVKKLLERYANLTFINGYGPTESTTFAATKMVASQDDYTDQVNNIGRPISNTQILILNEESSALMPIGIAGEICIGGDGLARGYLNRPELSEQKFVNHPFAKGQKIYKTGDLGRWLASGDIEFLGRVDDQVKIRGYRIEPGEIEAALQSSDLVAQCVVLIKDDANGDKTIVAYVKANGTYDKAGIQQYLKTNLPDFMLPSVYMELEVLPLTNNGKVDRVALPEPVFTDLVDSEYEAPQTEAEEGLIEIWKQVLNIDRIGINDDFFELGGHSLLAMRMISAIRAKFKVELKIKDIFLSTTVQELAAFIESQETSADLPTITVQERPERIPLSFAQERLWFIDQMDGSIEYHIPNIQKLKGGLNISAFKKAFSALVNRHEVLRTVIREENGDAFQFILPPDQWQMDHYEDPAFLADEKALEDFIEEYVNRPFNLSEDHPIRVSLIKTAEEEYIFAIVLHHIASDSWSSNVMLDEFFAYYQAFEKNSEANLPPLKIQYADFAIWQRAFLKGEKMNAQLSFWKKTLDNVVPLDFPTDYSRPLIRSNNGREITLNIDQVVTDKIMQLAAEEGVTPFMFLLSGFKALLHKYTGQLDLCIGIPIAGRMTAEAEALIGFFVNSLCLRTEVEETMSFRNLLQKVKQTTVDAYAHQMVPFEQVVEHLGVERDLSRNPLFQVMFDYLETPEVQEVGVASIEMENQDGGIVSTQRDLDLNIVKAEQGLDLNLMYCTELFSDATAEQLLKHLKALLTQVVNQPETKLDEIEVLNNEETEELKTWSQNPFEGSNVDTIISLFNKQVAAKPDAVALLDAEQSISFKELDRWSNQIAHLLIANNLTSESRVGLCLDASVEMIAAMLGIFKAGGAYLPLDPSNPEQRIQYMIEDAESQVVLCAKDYQYLFKDQQNLICLTFEQAQQEATTPVDVPLSPQQLAYVIYTSGSTGRPKGVKIEHAAVVNEILYTGHLYGADSNEHGIVTSSFAFDSSVEQIYMPLLHGGTTVIVEKETLLDSEAFTQYLIRQKVTHLDITPSLLKKLEPQKIGSLKRIICGGEWVPFELAKSWAPYVDFYNAYGPTEATVSCALYKYEDAEWVDKLGSLPVGRPMGNYLIYILDAKHRLVPKGVIGDIYVGGASLTRGYLNREELNRDKFMPSPFDETQRLYQTGDRGRWMSNGNIDFVGRKDEQIKIRGYRIELGEIENSIIRSSFAEETVVMVEKEENGDQYIVAYLVPEANYDQNELRAYLKEELPRYMLPSIIVELDEIPLTINDKIDYRALSGTDISALSKASFVACSTPTEQVVANIWQELLKREQVGAQDNFFEIGGHSLMVMRMVSAIRTQLNVELKIRDLFLNATVAELSAEIDKRASSVSLPSIEVLDRPDDIPLSFAQERLWFIDQLGGSVEYHIPNILRIEGDINLTLFNECFKEIVRRHEVLRTVYKEKDGIAYQHILSEDNWAIDIIDRTDNNDPVALEQFVNRLISRPFNLAKDYMIRIYLIKVAADSYLFVTNVHHIASDGWSGTIIINEFAELYDARSKNQKAELPALDIQYADFSIWQRTHYNEERLEEQLSYWRDQLAEIEYLELPTDYLRPALQSNEGGYLNITLDRDLSNQLSSLAKETNTTDFMLLLAAFKVLLYKYTGQRDICLGTPIAGRTITEVEPLVGFFVNMLPIRTLLMDNPTFDEFLQEVKDTTLEAYDNQAVPFEQIVEAIGLDRDMSRNPVFQITFSIGNTPEIESEGVEGIKIMDNNFGQGQISAQRDLSVEVMIGEEGIEVSATYLTDLFEEATVAQLLKDFEGLLAQIVEQPNQEIEQINILDAATEITLLGLGRNATDTPAEATIISLFQQQAAEYPEATALIQGDLELTYQQLNERSDQLAKYLQTQYTAKDAIIGICSEHSTEMIVGMLAALKSTATYVAISPDYSTRQIEEIIALTSPQVILTSEAYQDRFASTPKIILDGSYPATDQQLTAATTIDQQITLLLDHTSDATLITQAPINAELLDRLMSQLNDLAIEPSDRILLSNDYSTPIAVEQIFLSLLSGATLVLAEEARRAEGDQLANLITTFKIDQLSLRPSVLQTLPKEAGQQLKQVIVTGGHCPLKLAADWATQVDFYNKYGTSNGQLSYTLYKYDAEDISNHRQSLPIGQPIGSTRIYLLDEALNLVSKGLIGELYIGRSKIQGQETTTDAWRPSPFSSDEVIFRTGDLARWSLTGNLEYKGRAADTVMVKGQKVSLGEVEKYLLTAPGVANAALTCKELTEDSAIAIAYVIPKEGYDEQTVLEYLRIELPEYMIPSLFVEMDQLPRTLSGAIDKSNLPEQDLSDLLNKKYIAPRNETEKVIANIWGDLLRIDRLGIHDNFFQIGGHSLMVVRVVSAIRTELEVEILVRDLFRYATIEALATFIDKQKTQASSVNALPTLKAVHPRPERIPLSFAQERIWFIDQLQGSLQYHDPNVLRIHEKLDPDSLGRAFKTIVSRHEILRTVIIEEQGAQYQRILEPDCWQPNFINDYSYTDEESLSAYIDQMIYEPFDLSKDPPFRLSVIKLKEDEFVIIILLHHIATDGWSDAIMIDEFSALYAAYESGQGEEVLPPLEIQYADYAIWENENAKNGFLDGQLDYWKEQLAGVPPTEFPTDFTRPPIQSIRGAQKSFSFDPQLVRDLKTLAGKEGMTLFMLMLSAFKVLLYRYTQQKDLCIGVPIAGRTIREVEPLIGMFINTLALRTQLEEGMTTKDLLQSIKQTTLDAYENQLVSFEQIVDAVDVERDMSRSPIYQILFTFQNTPEADGEVHEGMVIEEFFEGGDAFGAKNDLNIGLIQTGDALEMGVTYCTDLYLPNTIDRLLEHYEMLLKSMVDLPLNTPVDQLEMITADEKAAFAEEVQGASLSYSKELTIVDLFEQQLSQHAQKTAVVAEGQTLTFEELNQKVNQLARFLAKKGVGKEDLVGICVERSFEMIIGIMGIIKAGAAYLPIDPDYPEERIRFMIEDAQPRLVLSTKTYQDRLEQSESKLVLLDECQKEIEKEDSTNLNLSITPDQLLYVIYTSGSTGKPKGVMNQHSGLVNRLLWTQDHFDLQVGKDVILQKTTFCFDVSVWELLWPMITGVKMVFAQPEGHKDNFYLKSIIEQEKVTTLHFVPSMLEVFLLDIQPGDCPDLQRVICSGEALTPHQVNLFKERLSHVSLHNLYGPTEAAIDVTYWDVPTTDQPVNKVPIGKAVANTQLYILDPSGNRLPKGVTGELYIGGIQVARGYLNRPALTAERFIANPFDPKDPYRLYKTGDLARRSADGNIEYQGRIDAQVKIRGFRIELGEIENAIQQSDNVSQAVVLAKKDTNGQARLVAYVTAEEGYQKEKVQEELRARLPEYMTPSIFVEIDEMPLTSNGKVNRKALPTPDLTQLSGKAYVAPRNEVEAFLAETCQELLNVEKVGIHDQFFDLGGNSLMVIRMVSAIKAQLNVELKVQDVFLNTSIVDLAAKINQQKSVKGLAKVEPQERPDYIPLSFAQERLWFIDQLGGSLEYHISNVLKIDGNLDLQLADRCFQKIVDRHEILRTVYREKAGVAYQYVLPDSQWTVQVIENVKGKSPREIEHLVDGIINEPFNLAEDHPIRIVLIQLNEKEHLFVSVMHHIASDGWSSSLLINEFTQLYEAKMNQEVADLPKLDVQFIDYAIWQRNQYQGAILEEQLGYWKTQLADLGPLDLPTDYQRPPIQSNQGDYAQITLNAALTEKLANAAQSEKVTDFMLLLAAFKLLLHKYSGQGDICIGTPVAGRMNREIEPLIGFFVNILPIRTLMTEDLTFRALLGKVKQSILEAFDNQVLPFEQIVDATQSDRDMSRSPIFQVSFSMGDTPVEEDNELTGIQIDENFFRKGQISAQRDLSFEIASADGVMTLGATYCTDLFREETIVQMLEHFEEILNQVVADPSLSIEAVDLLLPAEEGTLMALETNPFEYPETENLVSLFAQQAAKCPDRTALVFGSNSMSYEMLDRESNRLANHLIAQGVEAEEMVGICVDRSMEMIIAILGILKSGAAYVPLNPAYPVRRIEQIIDNADIRWVLSLTTTERSTWNTSAELIELDSWLANNEASTAAPQITIQQEQLATVIFTSGSTSIPKGVQLEHKGIVNEITYQMMNWSVDQEDRILLSANYVFDASIEQIFLALLSSATLVLITEEQLLDKDQLEQVLIDYQVSHFHSTPSLLQNIRPAAYPNLKRVLAGGETCPLSLARSWAPYVDFYNKYGPSETTINSTIYHFNEADYQGEKQSLAIGKPLGNTQIYILNDQLERVPKGVIGQIYIGGAGLSRGYLNNDELTADKFIDSPFIKGERLYQTGDLGRWAYHGNLEFKGRKDTQVKIRGQRVEIGEIEKALLANPGIRSAAVVSKDLSETTKALVAYVIPEFNYSKDQVMDELRREIPEYMIPAFFVEVEEFALTISGKIDRLNLPAFNPADFISQDYVAPRNEVEEAIAQIWTQLLDIPKIGIHDNFFELGGHSLMATRVVSAIREELGIDLSLRSLFQYTCIADLSKYIKVISSTAEVENEEEYETINL